MKSLQGRGELCLPQIDPEWQPGRSNEGDCKRNVLYLPQVFPPWQSSARMKRLQGRNRLYLSPVYHASGLSVE
jgi:hypothetical protein